MHIYIDNDAFGADTYEELMDKLGKVLERAQDNRFVYNWKDLRIGYQELELLGYLSSQGFSFCLPLASASLKSRRTSSISGLSTFGLWQFRLMCPLVPQFKQRSMSLASSSPLLNSSACV